MNAESTLANHDIRLDRRNLGNHEMSIFLSGIVASVEDLQTGDLDEEHRSA